MLAVPFWNEGSGIVVAGEVEVEMEVVEDVVGDVVVVVDATVGDVVVVVVDATVGDVVVAVVDATVGDVAVVVTVWVRVMIDVIMVDTVVVVV